MRAGCTVSYHHGGDVYRNPNIKYDFSINVNPLGMPDFVKRAAVEGVYQSFRYPDSECGRLKALAAAHYRVPEKNLVFGNGAAELIFGIVRAVEPKRAVLLAPSFTEYEKALKAAGSEICFFYLKGEDGFLLPTEKYLEFLERKKPDMIFLCNPANPVGNTVGRAEMEKILNFCRKQEIFVVVDECFLDFLENGSSLSVSGMACAGYENLFVLQALTKSFAMAGLRLGYGFLSNEELLKRLRTSIQPWNVSIPAQEAGCAAFGPEREEYLGKTRKLLGAERGYLKKGLQSAGFQVFSSDANFLLFKDKNEAGERALYEFFLSRGILIRCCGDFKSLDGRYYRVCVKQHEENRRLLETFGTNI